MLPGAQRIRTLVVDDSAIAVRAICSCLEDEPAVQVVGTASDGVEALSIAERLQPDLILLDLQMPRMNGFEVASRLAKEYPAILVFIITGIDAFNVVNLSELGVHGIIAKQHLSEQLPELLQQILQMPPS